MSPNNGFIVVKADAAGDGNSNSPKRNPPVNGFGLSPVNKLDRDDVFGVVVVVDGVIWDGGVGGVADDGFDCVFDSCVAKCVS